VSRTPEQIHDEWLVLAAQGGEAEALETLIRRWLPAITRHAWRLTGDADAAADVVQESSLAIVRGLPRLDDPATFGTWVARIVSNKAADWIRGRRRQRRLEASIESTHAPDRSGHAAIDARSDGSDAAGLMGQAIDALPSRWRAVIGLYYGKGLSVAQAARALGVPPGTVKSRLHHARHRLRIDIERKQS
jgi:RNA polymerase sigma factor (sigma-70 family)